MCPKARSSSGEGEFKLEEDLGQGRRTLHDKLIRRVDKDGEFKFNEGEWSRATEVAGRKRQRKN